MALHVILDIETDSFEQRGGPQKIHCVETLTMPEGDQYSFVAEEYNADGFLPLSELPDLLLSADAVIAHNGLNYDFRHLNRLLGITLDPSKLIDTMIGARALHPDKNALTAADAKIEGMPTNLYGKHKLEAWGYRLGIHKGSFGKATDWRKWTPEMSEYCQQDTLICAFLWAQLREHRDHSDHPFFSSPAYALERDLIPITSHMTDVGFPFNTEAAQKLLADIEEASDGLLVEIQAAFPPIMVETPFTPKRNNKTKGYVAGITVKKQKLVPFNPNSSQQIAARLIERHDWKPTKLTANGEPSTAAKVLATLDYPEARLLLANKIAEKRITMMTGDRGWFASVVEDRLHTEYFTNATITGRASHSPNVAQVPKVAKRNGQLLKGVEGAWGFECRSLFHAPDDWLLVGADMSGLELRCLAHYLAPFDGGDYVKLATEGDPHSATQAATGIDSRETAKTLIYATIYGAGYYRVGSIVEPEEEDEHHLRSIGEDVKKRLISGIHGFGDLFRWLKYKNSELEGLDGRVLVTRRENNKLNALLQSAGAILCKRWLVLIDSELRNLGLHPGVDYELLAWVHDEVIAAARNQEIAEIVLATCKEQAVKAGEYYNFLCPTAADGRIGHTWADVH